MSRRTTLTQVFDNTHRLTPLTPQERARPIETSPCRCGFILAEHEGMSLACPGDEDQARTNREEIGW